MPRTNGTPLLPNTCALKETNTSQGWTYLTAAPANHFASSNRVHSTVLCSLHRRRCAGRKGLSDMGTCDESGRKSRMMHCWRIADGIQMDSNGRVEDRKRAAKEGARKEREKSERQREINQRRNASHTNDHATTRHCLHVTQKLSCPPSLAARWKMGGVWGHEGPDDGPRRWSRVCRCCVNAREVTDKMGWVTHKFVFRHTYRVSRYRYRHWGDECESRGRKEVGHNRLCGRG